MISIKNNYFIVDNVVYIELVRRNGDKYYTIIDKEDLEKVKALKFSWHSWWAKDISSFYCRTSEYLGMLDGKPKYRTHYLHRIIMGDEKGKYIDHINHDTLDNRKSNLISTDNRTNILNRKSANKNNSTGVRNVTFEKATNKYIIQLQVDGKNKVFGKYDSIDEAAENAEIHRKEVYDLH